MRPLTNKKTFNSRLWSLPWFRILLGVFSGFLVGVVGLAYLMAGEVYDYLDTFDGVHFPEVDAIVVLAGGRGRIATAGDVWVRYFELGRKSSKIPTLYLSGVGHKTHWGSVAPQFRPGVLAILRPEQVIIENESTNTVENAEWLLSHVKKNGWKRILLLTSRYHMRRSRWILERVFETARVPLEIETLSVYQEPFEPGEWRESFQGVRVTLEEFLKWIYFRRIWTPAFRER